METTKVTPEGQITLPEDIRDELGLRSGDEIEFIAESTGYRIRKKIRPSQPFRGYIGYLRDLAGQDPDAILREARGE